MLSECDEDTSKMNGDLFICSFSGCPKTFRRRDRLRNHVESCHGEKNPFCCTHEGCDKSYHHPAGLKRHMNNAHSENTKTSPTIRCTFEDCDATFTCKDNLKKHVKRIHENRQFKCSHCAKTFIKRQQLKIHEFQHTGVKPFKCLVDGCEKDFLLPSVLKAHMKVHNGYKCSSDGCDLMFETWSLQQKHVKNDHVIDHKCSICDKSFSNKKNLRNHLAIHTDKREIFNCPREGCSSFFYYAKNLSQHMKAKHEGKMFECEHLGCNMQFTHKSTLVKHLKVHDPSYSPKLKPKRKCLKRRSVAARLSRYNATREEEISVIYPETRLQKEKMPIVVVISSDPDHHTADLDQSNELKTEPFIESKAYENDGNPIECDESLKTITNDGNLNEIQSIVCKAAA